jgi:hypothetical protein
VPPTPDSEWNDPVPVKIPWHLPPKHPNKTWKQFVIETGLGETSSRYGPRGAITEPMIRGMEMGVVKTVTKSDLTDEEIAPIACGELPRTKDHVREFWGKQGQKVGAALGEETEYIFVEYHQSGAVHGRPMTKKMLIELGMQQ